MIHIVQDMAGTQHQQALETMFVDLLSWEVPIMDRRPV